MGASIENNHLLAALVEKTKQLGKCEIIPKKVVEVRAAKSMQEKPRVTLDDGS